MPTSTNVPAGLHPNAAVVAASFSAFARGDLAAVAASYAPDIRWHVSGRNRLAGTYQGVDAVLGYFGSLMEVTGGTFQPELHDLVGGDDHVVFVGRFTAMRDSRRFAGDELVLIHVRDGKFAEAWQVPADQAGWDEFLS